jgi:hypothetical protein
MASRTGYQGHHHHHSGARIYFGHCADLLTNGQGLLGRHCCNMGVVFAAVVVYGYVGEFDFDCFGKVDLNATVIPGLKTASPGYA